jgi:hypothetical protein
MRVARLRVRILDILPIVVVGSSWHALRGMWDPWGCMDAPRTPEEKSLRLFELVQDATLSQSRLVLAALVLLTLVGFAGARTRRSTRSLVWAQVAIAVSCASFATFIVGAEEALRAMSPTVP